MFTTVLLKLFPKLENLPHQIKTIYLITFLGELYLIIPIWMFFYLKYLTFEQIALITIIQQITSIVLEVPTGAFADLFGKRKTLIISYILYTISLFLTPFGNVLIYFIGLEIIKGVAKALYSGSFEALTFDTLKEKGLDRYYPNVTSNLVTLSWVAYILAGILGGIMYDLWFGLPYIILAFFYFFIVILFIFKIKEPKIDTVKITVNNYLKQNINGFRELFSNLNITFITILLGIITLGYYTASELLGISQGKQYGLSGTQVGIIFSCGYIISALLSSLFPLLLKKYKSLSIVISTTFFLLFSFLLAKFVSPLIGSLLIVLRISSSSTFSNVRSVLLNNNISSKNRATALSSFSLLYEIGYVLIAYFAGIYIGNHSPNDFAFILGIIVTLGICLISIYTLAIKVSNKIKQF